MTNTATNTIDTTIWIAAANASAAEEMKTTLEPMTAAELTSSLGAPVTAPVTVQVTEAEAAPAASSPTGGIVGGVVGGVFVPVLVLVLWLTGALARFKCPSPLRKSVKVVDAS